MKTANTTLYQTQYAPIAQWHDEVVKIRRGVMLLKKMPKPDSKKTKELKQRSKKLFDNAFLAAVN